MPIQPFKLERYFAQVAEKLQLDYTGVMALSCSGCLAASFTIST